MKVFLVDGSAMVYRSHFAMMRQPLQTSHGEVTSAAYGSLQSLIRLYEEEKGDVIIVAFDTKTPTFRHEMYDQYKAHRPPMPDDLRQQIPRVKQLIRSMGLPLLEMPGFEADDIVGTLAREGAERGHDVWIYSADKDFVPLVGPGVGILRPGTRTSPADEYLDTKALTAKHGVRPPQFLDVLTLIGDKSDNIPGVPGIGEKTAVKLISQFESLPRLLDHLSDKRVSARHRRLIEENREQFDLARRLLTIDDKVDVDYEWREEPMASPYTEEFRQLCRELEFFQLLDRIGGEGQRDNTGSKMSVTVPQSLQELDKCLNELAGHGAWALATLMDGESPHHGQLLGLALCAEEASAIFLPVGGAHTGSASTSAPASLFDAPVADSGLAWDDVRTRLEPYFMDVDRPKWGHDIKSEQIILARHGLSMAGVQFDSMLGSYLLAPERRQHGLEFLASEILGQEIITQKTLRESAPDKDLRRAEVDQLALAAAQRADMTFRLSDLFSDQLKAEELDGVMDDLELPLAQVLLRMERRGIRLDVDHLSKLSVDLHEKVAESRRRIYELAGEEFNLNSPKQLQHILFDKLGLKPTKKTSTGYSTDVSVLGKLAKEHELPALLLEYRQVQKLLSTYVETLPQLVHADTGCVHTHYNQAVAATGRLSSENPNLQNIPIRSELGRRIREAFVAPNQEWVLLAADYSQIELRLMAHLCEDEAMIAAFVSGEDIHARTAALVNDVQIEDVTAEMRRQAKAINFGLLYGMGARALAQQIEVKTAQAQTFIDQYFSRFPRVREYVDSTVAEARVTGEVRTLLGRRRRLPELASRDQRQKAFGERIAVNTPIQGTAADLIKLAMIRLDARLRNEDLPADLLLQVHDELILQVEPAAIDAVTSVVRETMENVWELKVPLVVDAHAGPNWARAHP